MTLVRLLPLFLLACTGAPKDEDTGPDTDVETDTDTGDTGSEPEPVWESHPVGSSSTFNGVFVSADGIHVVGTAAGAYRGTPAATSEGVEVSWAEIVVRDPEGEEIPGDEDFLDLWGQGTGATLELLAGATSGNVARYTGGSWDVEDLGTSNHEGVGGSGVTALYAVSWGGIYRFDGATWTFEAPPGDARLNDIWVSGDNVIAVGEGGAILRRDPENGWEEVDSGTDADLNAIGGTALNDLWAVGAEGTILHFDGVEWTASTSGVSEALWGVFAPSTTAAFVVGNNGTALLWNGEAWESLPTGVTNNLYAIHGSSEADVWAVGNRGMTLVYVPE